MYKGIEDTISTTTRQCFGSTSFWSGSGSTSWKSGSGKDLKSKKLQLYFLIFFRKRDHLWASYYSCVLNKKWFVKKHIIWFLCELILFFSTTFPEVDPDPQHWYKGTSIINRTRGGGDGNVCTRQEKERRQGSCSSFGWGLPVHPEGLLRSDDPSLFRRPPAYPTPVK